MLACLSRNFYVLYMCVCVCVGTQEMHRLDQIQQLQRGPGRLCAECDLVVKFEHTLGSVMGDGTD